MTATTTIPTVWAALHAALQARQPLWVTYHERRRLICPHAIGWKANRAMVLGYQTGGDTTSGTLDPDPNKRWRVPYIDEIDDITTAPGSPTWGTADNYNPTHPFPVIDQLAAAVDHQPSPAPPTPSTRTTGNSAKRVRRPAERRQEITRTEDSVRSRSPAPVSPPVSILYNDVGAQKTPGQPAWT